MRFLPMWTNSRSSRDRLLLTIMHLASIIDALVFLCSLTLLTTEFRAQFLFCDWAMDED